jgi:hypothetical protein
MRDILDKIDTILTEKARGLLYRDPGDQFFQGSKENPTAELKFDRVDYYPGQPGKYATYDEMSAVGGELFKQYPQITWVNKPTSNSRSFAILTFDGPGAGQKSHFGKFFGEIKADMSGMWGNSELPGGWQLNKQASLKGSYYKLKPSDLFEPDSVFATPSDCVAAIKANPKNNPAVPIITPGMEELLTGVLPTFNNVGEMNTAIRDDLGETIGPIALIQGMPMGTGAEAARKDILGPKGSYAGASIFFPASKINGLVDSYITTPDGTEIGISSKGEQGAKASVKNIADGIKVARERGMTELLDKYVDQVKIIEKVGQLSSVQFPLVFGIEQELITPDQSYIIMDLIKKNAKSIDQVPMSAEDKEVLQEIMDRIKPQINNPRYNVGYHILSVLARDVSTAINSDPMFGEACLKFLNTSPIIQLHMSVSGKNDVKVTGFTSKYPPDFKGTVGLDASKVYAATGTNGRVSFSYNGGGDEDTDVPEPGGEVLPPTEIDVKSDELTQQRSKVKAAAKGVEPSASDEKTLGRKRRK